MSDFGHPKNTAFYDTFGLRDPPNSSFRDTFFKEIVFLIESAEKFTKKTAFCKVFYRFSPVSQKLKPCVLRLISNDLKRKRSQTE